MAISDIGESLLARAGEQSAAAAREASKARKKQRRAQYLGIAGAIAGNYFQRKADRQAEKFLQMEPILAARTKYNLGVKNSIQTITNHEKAMSHANGMLDYYTEMYQPEIEEQLKKSVRPEQYSKTGFDTFVYNKAKEHAQKMIPLHERAYNAALKVGGDKAKDFDKFIEINDGIPDSRLGAAAQGIFRMFKGQSEEALSSRINSITNSRYVANAEAMNEAFKAVQNSSGLFNEGDVTKLAKGLENAKKADSDWIIQSEEDATRNVYKAGQQFTRTGKNVTEKDGWGLTRTRFVPDDGEGAEDATYESETFERNGMRYQRRSVTTYDKNGVPTKVEGDPKYVGPALEPVKASDAEDLINGLITDSNNYNRLTDRKILWGQNSTAITREQLGAYISQNQDYTKDKDNKLQQAQRQAFGRSLIEDANNVMKASRTIGLAVDAKEALTVTNYMVLNDIARSKDGRDLDLSFNVRNDTYNPLLVLEAYGAMAQNDVPLNIGFARSIPNSKEFHAYLNNPATKKQREQLYKEFSAYDGVEGYEILFGDIVRVTNGGRTVSVMDELARSLGIKEN